MQSVTAQIDTQALRRNLAVIRSLVPSSKIVAIVKADAYGHGLCRVSEVLQDGVEAFGVARVGEALQLHEHGIRRPVFLLEGFYFPEEVPVIARYGFISAVHDHEQLRMLEADPPEPPLSCWLKIDIGMHRLGAAPGEVDELREGLERCPGVRQPVGLISHLSVADTPAESAYNAEQIELFRQTARRFAGPACLANSAGILCWPDSHTEYVRPGIILYGISPFAGRCGADHGLFPVMTLRSSLIARRRISRGARVGYGAAWQAPRDTVLGIVAAGYGDGYPRTAPNGTPVYIGGRLVPTAGHVCMDMLFVDLGPDSTDRIGDEVILWGPQLPVERIAEACGTIPYELVCRVMPRVRFEYV